MSVFFFKQSRLGQFLVVRAVIYMKKNTFLLLFYNNLNKGLQR